MGGETNANDTQVRALDDAYRFDPQTNQWQQLATRAPRGLVGTVATTLDGSQAVLLGGVNKAILTVILLILRQPEVMKYARVR